MAPEPTREIVIKKLRDCFPNVSHADDALAALDVYGAEPWHRERERVQLAILMQSAGDLDRLLELVCAANMDYRDVLVGAEFVEEFEASIQTPPDEMAAIRRRDRANYDGLGGEQ